MKAPVGVGMIGLGLISWIHEAGYNQLGERCRIVAMCDVDPDMAKNRAALHNAAAHTDYRHLLEDPDVGMVDVAVPHDLHHPVVMAAIEAGKHVLVEKPIAVTSALAREMIDAAAAAGVTLSVAENTPFVAAYTAVEKLLQDGVLGEVRTVRSLIAGSEVERIRDPKLWHGRKPYGGVILDSAVHSLYLYRWLFGGVKDVRSFASTLVPEGEAEDNGLLIGTLENGADYQLDVSCTMEIPWTERLEVYGSEGSLIVDQLIDPVVTHYRAGSVEATGTPVGGVPYEPQQWKFQAMFAEVADFVDALLAGRPPRVDPEDTLYAVRVVEAAHRSIERDEKVTGDGRWRK